MKSGYELLLEQQKSRAIKPSLITRIEILLELLNATDEDGKPLNLITAEECVRLMTLDDAITTEEKVSSV